jgi:hypothetical protein
MNDNELSTAVRESVAALHSSTPVDQIISRGRAARARRRIPAAAGVLVVAGGAALGVATLVPAGHSGLPSGSHPAVVRLAAWTVAKQANGDIDITIKQLQDPARLQATLRADGLPVNVSFSGHVSAACRSYDISRSALKSVVQFNMSDGSDFLSIDPSALPSGAGVAIYDEPGKRLETGTPQGTTPKPGNTRLRGTVHPPAGATGPLAIGPLAIGLVYTSQKCTG